MRIFSAVFLLLLATPAFAAGKPAADKDPAPELDPKICAQMVTYQPATGVNGADYKPGVDVHGKPVVEADLNKSPVKVPDTVSFDIGINVARYAGLPEPKGTWTMASMGKVTVDKDGHMTYNGEPMEGDAEAALRALCAPKPSPVKDSKPPAAPDYNKHNQ